MFVGCTITIYMICYTQTELQKQLQSVNRNQIQLGFVPTMGALHDGHISLVAQALSENDVVVVSIFVNPTQFNNAADLTKYPRTLSHDLELLKAKADFDRLIVYAPQVEDVYGSQLVSKNYDFGLLDTVMEGANRPGHFNGVGTILEFLFKLIRPDRAYFGEKDFQQLQVVKSLTKQLNLPIEIIGCSIMRESNMLAMSSRNERLTKESRDKAGIIYQSLIQAKKIYNAGNLEESLHYITSLYNELNEFDLEYFAIANEENLKPITVFNPEDSVRAFIVVYIDGIRLIDNLNFN